MLNIDSACQSEPPLPEANDRCHRAQINQCPAGKKYRRAAQAVELMLKHCPEDVETDKAARPQCPVLDLVKAKKEVDRELSFESLGTTRRIAGEMPEDKIQIALRSAAREFGRSI